MRLAVWIVACVLSLSPAFAHDYRVGDLSIHHPWIRQPPKGAAVAAGFLTIENRGGAADKLIAASLEIAGKTEIHKMAVGADGVMVMRPLDAIDLAPGATVELQGDLHVMATRLKRLPAVGEKIKGTLTFEKAGAVAVDFLVEPIAMKDPHSGHEMEKAR